MFKMKPDPKFLLTPMIAMWESGDDNLTPDYITQTVPVINWLVRNVGELGYFQTGEWPTGNGWQIGYDKDTVEVWGTQCYVMIRKEIDDILLTEFVLRFA